MNPPELRSLDEAVSVALAAVDRAVPDAAAAEPLRALTRAARSQKNTRRVCTTFVSAVLPGFARAALSLRRPSADGELLVLLEAALQAGLFAPSLAVGHVAAVGALDTHAADASEGKEPAKRRRTVQGCLAAEDTAQAREDTPQALLYASVCASVRAGARSELLRSPGRPHPLAFCR